MKRFSAFILILLLTVTGTAMGQNGIVADHFSPAVVTTLDQLDALLNASDEHANGALQAYRQHAAKRENATLPRFDVLSPEQLALLYGVQEISTDDVVQRFSGPLSDVLLGGLPSHSCENGELKTVERFDESTAATPADIWDRLVDGDFLVVGLMFDARTQIRGLQREGSMTDERRALQCQMLNFAVTELRCLHQPELEACNQSYSERLKALVQKEKALIVPDYAQQARTQFARVRPHLANLGEPITEAKSSTALLKAVEDTLTEAAVAELAFQRNVALARFLLSLDDAMLAVLEVNRESIERTLSELDRLSELATKGDHAALVATAKTAAQAAALAEVAPELDKLRARVDERVLELQTLIKDAEVAARAEGERAFKTLEQNIIGGGCAEAKEELEKAKEALSSGGVDWAGSRAPVVPDTVDRLTVHAEPRTTGRLSPDGAELFDVDVYLVKRSDSLDMTVAPQAKGGPASLHVPCLENTAIAPRGELIALNITMKDMVSLADGGFAPGGTALINRQIHTTANDLDRVMRALGVPIFLRARGVTAEIDDAMRNLDLIASFSPLPGRPAVEIRLSVLKDGRVESGDDIRKAFENSVIAWFEQEAQHWLEGQPWVQGAQDAVTQPLALLADAGVTVEARPDGRGFIINWPVRLASADPVVQKMLGQDRYRFTAAVDRRGVHLIGEDIRIDSGLQEALEKALSMFAERHIESAKSALANVGVIDRVLPLVDAAEGVLSLKVQVDVSAETWGCPIRHRIISDFPFDRFEGDLKSALGVIEEGAADCIRQHAERQILEALTGQRLNLFGIEVEWVGEPTVGRDSRQGQQAIRIDDSRESGVLVNAVVNVIDEAGKWRLKIGPEFWGQYQDEFGLIVEHRLKKLLGEDYLEIDGSRVVAAGYSVNVTLKDVPYLGRVPLGRVHFNATDNRRIEKQVGGVIRAKLNDELKRLVKRLGDLPDIGPFRNPEPQVGLLTESNQLTVRVQGEVPLYGDYVVRPVTVQLLPKFEVIPPREDQLLGTLLSSVLGSKLTLGSLSVNKAVYGPIAGEGVYGVAADVEVHIAEVIRFGARVALTPDRVTFPGDLVVRLPTPIYLEPIVIAEPGVRFNFNTGALKLEGDITIVEAAMSHVAKVESSLGLEDEKEWTFKLNGDLVAVNSVTLLSAEGTFSFGKARAEYHAGTAPMIKALLEAKASGTLDGEKKYADSRTLLRILGVKLADSSFLLGFPPDKPNDKEGRLEFSGYQGLGIGGLTYGAGTTLRLQNPWVQGGIELDLAGWDVFNGDLWLDLSRAILNFRALGIKIKVIAPSITNITPDLLLQILANLLKVDLSALLDMKLDEVTISLMDAGGNVSDATSESSNGDSEQSQDPVGNQPASEPTPLPNSPDEETPIRRQPIDEGDQNGGFSHMLVCEEVLPGRFEFWAVRPGTDHEHKHKPEEAYMAMSTWHRSTLPSKHADIIGGAGRPQICQGRTFNQNVWFPLAPRADWQLNGGFSADNCSPEGRFPATVITREKARWSNIYPYACGTLPPISIPTRERTKRFDTGEVVKQVDRDRIEASDDLQRKILQEYFLAAATKYREYGNAVSDHTFTRVVFEDDDCFLGFFACKHRVLLQVYLAPTEEEHFWTQSFQLLLHRETGDYYALTMCEDSAVTGQRFNISDPRYQVLCAQSRLIRLAGPEDLPRERQATMQPHWLTAPELEFLVKDRAGPRLEDLAEQEQRRADRELSSSFELFETQSVVKQNQKPKTYDVQQVQIPEEETLRYVAAMRANNTEVRTVDFPPGHPLVEWMQGRFRNDVLLQKLTHEGTQFWYADTRGGVDQGPLVLRTQFIEKGKALDSVWLFASSSGQGTVSKALRIPDRNPYSNVGLSEDEKTWLFKALVNVVRQGDWRAVHLAVAPDSKRQLLLLVNDDSLKVMFWDISDNRTLIRKLGGEWIEARLEPLAACLGVDKQAVVRLMLNADRIYRTRPGSITLRQHPFDIMTRPRCH